MPRTIHVIFNQSSGAKKDAPLHDQIRQLFQDAGVNAILDVAQKGGDVPRLAKQAAKGQAEIVVAAGGDGTISGVASALVNTDKSLGVIPQGTFNFFARRNNIPLDLEPAIQNIVNGQPIPINVGEVNGHYFLNNSSIGRYSMTLRQRNKAYRRFGRSRIVAFLANGVALLRPSQRMTITMQADNTPQRHCESEFVFICNNRELLDLYNIRGVNCLDADALAVLVSEPLSKFKMFKLGFSMLFRKMDTASGYDALCAKDLHLESRRKRLDVVIDGEIQSLPTPLDYKVHPRALRLIVPADNH